MLVNLHSTGIAILDSIFYPLTMLGVGYCVTKLPRESIHSTSLLFRNWTFESLRFYEKAVKIRSWKNFLPDGSALFRSGFRKKALQDRSTEYYQTFITETYRGELAHTIDIFLLSLLWIWNPFWIAVGMTLLGLIGNFPCIFVQRYNRIRFLRILKRSMIG